MISREDLEAMGVEYVSGSADGRRQGYFRKIPRTRKEPSIRQCEHRLVFTETANETFGARGVVKTPDNRQISSNAAKIGDKLRGTGQPRREPSMQEKLIRLILEG